MVTRGGQPLIEIVTLRFKGGGRGGDGQRCAGEVLRQLQASGDVTACVSLPLRNKQKKRGTRGMGQKEKGKYKRHTLHITLMPIHTSLFFIVHICTLTRGLERHRKKRMAIREKTEMESRELRCQECGKEKREIGTRREKKKKQNKKS